MKYRDVVLHYHSDLNIKEIDCYFTEVFSYAKTEGEELPNIQPQDIPEPSKDDEEEGEEVVPDQVNYKAPS